MKMDEINFIYEGVNIKMQCYKDQKMKDICNNLSLKVGVDLNSLVFLYGGKQLNLAQKLNEITKENNICILVYKNEEETCSKCGRILNNKVIDEVIIINKKINDNLNLLKRQIELITKDIKNKKDTNYINSQLIQINITINNIINEDIKKMNNTLNQIENYNTIRNINNKNEIICIYSKKKDEISLLHDYNLNFENEFRKLYLEGMNNINEKNIDIYINDKKIPFNYKYNSSEIGEIYKCSSLKSIDFSSFNTTNVSNMSSMFSDCSSLKSLDLSSFDTNNVNDMSYMFRKCSSLNYLDLISFNTNSVNDMSYMFFGCSSLKSLDLSSFNTNNVNNMNWMFSGCSSLKSLDLSSFDTNNVKEMRNMFSGSYSLEYLDLSSFNATNVNNMSSIFKGCSSLKKDNLKINDYGIKILNEL